MGCQSWVSTGVQTKEFRLSEIGESIDRHSIGLERVGVVSHDIGLIRLVDSESIVMFLLIEVELSMMCDVVVEHCFIKIVICRISIG